MLQRIQTLFFLFTALFQGAMLILTLAELVIDGNNIICYTASGFNAEGILAGDSVNTYFIYTLIVITAFLPFVSVFLYKRRILQMRLSIYNIILLIGLQAVLFWLLYKTGTETHAVTNYKIPFIFPVVSVILMLLAYRYTRKDENLIRSLNRIR